MRNNLQYRRTHKAIISAFVKLSAQKSFDQLTVQDIMEEALVSRYAFYKHFRDKYEIAEQLQDQLLADLCCLMDQMRRENGMDQMAQNELWCRFAREHQECRAIWNIHTDTVDLQARFRELFCRNYLQQLPAGAGGIYRELEADICAAVQTTLMNFFDAEPNLNIQTLGEPIREVLINACLYLAKVEPMEEAKKALKSLQ